MSVRLQPFSQHSSWSDGFGLNQDFPLYWLCALLPKPLNPQFGIYNMRKIILTHKAIIVQLNKTSRQNLGHIKGSQSMLISSFILIFLIFIQASKIRIQLLKLEFSLGCLSLGVIQAPSQTS